MAAPERARREEIEATVTALGTHGDGVAETPHGRLFVPGTLPGERVRVVAETAVQGGRRARLRAEPPCPHFDACGGCAVQHLHEPRIRDWKRELVRQALARRGLDRAAIAPVVPVPAGSRRRAELAAIGGRRGPVLGFHARRSRRIVDIETCLVLRPALFSLLAPLRPIVRRMLLQRVLTGDSPVGLRTAPPFVPQGDPTDAEEGEVYAQSVSRLVSYEGEFRPHPGFGRLDHDRMLELFAAHAAHHLRFLEPTSAEETD